MDQFEKLPLHDAYIETIVINWEESSIEIRMYAFTVKAKDALPHILKFTDAEDIHVPHKNPWGESVFINSAEFKDQTYQLEMQSGDVIKIKSGGFSFKSTNL